MISKRMYSTYPTTTIFGMVQLGASTGVTPRRYVNGELERAEIENEEYNQEVSFMTLKNLIHLPAKVPAKPHPPIQGQK
jgi:hypothetical protein